jgi:hypothetical protein
VNNFKFSKMDKTFRLILKIGLLVVCSSSNAEQNSIAMMIDANDEYLDNVTVLSDVIESTESMIYGDLDGTLVGEKKLQVEAEIILIKNSVVGPDEPLGSVTVLSDVIESTESMIYGDLDGTLVGEEDFQIEAGIISTKDVVLVLNDSDSIEVEPLIESLNTVTALDDVIERTESMIYGDLDGYSETFQITPVIEKIFPSPLSIEVSVQSLDEQEHIHSMIMIAIAVVLIITFLWRNRNLKVAATETADEKYVDENTIIKELYIENEGLNEPEFKLDIDEGGSEDETVILDASDEGGSEDETVILDASDEGGSEDETVILDASDEGGSEDETVILDASDEGGSEDETVILDASDEGGSEDETVILDASDEGGSEDETVILDAGDEGGSEDETVILDASDEGGSEDETVILDAGDEGGSEDETVILDASGKDKSDEKIDDLKAYVDNEILDEPEFILDSDEDGSEDETVMLENNVTLQN